MSDKRGQEFKREIISHIVWHFSGQKILEFLEKHWIGVVVSTIVSAISTRLTALDPHIANLPQPMLAIVLFSVFIIVFTLACVAGVKMRRWMGDPVQELHSKFEKRIREWTYLWNDRSGSNPNDLGRAQKLWSEGKAILDDYFLEANAYETLKLKTLKTEFGRLQIQTQAMAAVDYPLNSQFWLDGSGVFNQFIQTVDAQLRNNFPAQGKTPRFGVYWDASLEPYCAVCDTLLRSHEGPFALKCRTCDDVIPLLNDKGIPMSIGRAREILKSG